MNRNTSTRFGILVFLGLAVLVNLQSAVGLTTSGQTVVRVEEDWELVVKHPDTNSAGPQIMTTMSPLGNVNFLHATFELNHQSVPDYVTGGMQVQNWNGENSVSQAKLQNNNSVLSFENEVVSWTQSMEVVGGNFVFEVTNGSSQTWGSFGSGNTLRVTWPTFLYDLNNYSRSVSQANSGVSFGKNHVTSLKLKQVRVYRADGSTQVYSDTVTVYQDPTTD